ncbi:MAG: DUF3332 domain-containing protein [Prevotellaceae bacterium]|jgi:hypothetical protein|nr:DUF3332 domain-containing protein [Prevotellaceae bacterium]
MKKIRVSIATLLAGAGMMLMSSCIGSFGLFNKVLSWNQTATNDKWINEVIFVCLSIVPVYELSWFLDAVLFNSLEFWTGESPWAGVDVTVKGEKGEYHVKSTGNGYHVELLGSAASADFLFDEASKTWTMSENGKSTKLVQFVDGDNAKFYFGASEMTVNMANTLNLLAIR